MAAVLMMSAAFTGCDNSSSSSESGKEKGFTIEAQITDSSGKQVLKSLTSKNKEKAFIEVEWENNKNPIKEVEIDIYFGEKEIGEVEFNDPDDFIYDGILFELTIHSDKEPYKSISDYLTEDGTYNLKVKAEDTKDKNSNTVTLTIDYSVIPE